MNLILASASPRRKELLSELGLPFTVQPAPFDESAVSLSDPEQGACALARGKALATLQKLKAEGSLPEDFLVLGADTVVAHKGTVMGKPKDGEDAYCMLSDLSGDRHQVYTGVALLTEDKEAVFAVKADVTFYPLTEAEIRAYIATGEPMDKAGAYGIQGYGRLLVKEISGDYFNVVGLPVAETVRQINRLTGAGLFLF